MYLAIKTVKPINNYNLLIMKQILIRRFYIQTV